MTATPLPGDPLDAALRLARSLEEHGVSYALGGALAYGVWAIPRATADVDVNVFLRDEALPALVEALSALGVALTVERARADGAASGLVIVPWGDFRLDLFLPSIPFAWEAERTRVRLDVEGQPLYVLSAEALAVFKLLFFRGKDLVDLERLVAVRGAALDAAYVRRQIVAMMGEDDERVQRWDAIVAACAPR